MNSYQITNTILTVIEFSDEEMIENGYELPITEEDRREYLKNIIEYPDYENNGLFSDYDCGCSWDLIDEEIKKIRGDE